MQNWQLFLALLFVTVISVEEGEALAEQAIRQRVTIQELGRRIIAVRGSSGSAEYELSLNEEVLWRRAFGDLGAVVTNRRVLAISSSSDDWLEQDLRLREPDDLEAAISSQILLVSTGDRVIIFDGRTNEFTLWRHRMQDRVLRLLAERDVAAIISDSAVVGYSPGNDDVIEHRLRLQEIVEGHDLTSSAATVRTNQRLLTYSAGARAWIIHDRRLNE